MSGWIKLYRKITENPLYFSEPFNRSLAWIDMLLLANHADNYFFKRGVKVDVKVGQIGYDLDSLAKRWKWSRGKVERFIKFLENDNQIVRQKTNVTTLISIVNYKDYQIDDKPNSKANNKPNDKANDKANGNKQECKELKERKELNTILSNSIIDKNHEKKIDLEKRTLEFKEIVKSYSDKYDIELLKSFFYYWSEPTQDNKFKMKYEIQKTWSIEGRLRTWKNNNYGNNNKNKTNETGIKSKERINAYFDLVNRYKNG